ncbi:RHS repeat domain-containing protein [Pseudomonas gingeri]|uniref:RHS repeat domain-containing protein n=1 Tax=Pseudomonas gingeri TaxID=117681 RepID=UPI002109B385|nr:RHS repeat-associated core domain-containing protein [Pseudomonas gingeri]
MPILAAGIHTHTPRLTVTDPRGLVVRSVGYCRSIEGSEPEERVNRSAYDAMGRLVEQSDPRLWALSGEDAVAPSNLVNRYSLSGKVLGSLSVDAGERISLFGDGDQLVQTWDSRGSERQIEYDNLLRLVAIFEQGEDHAPRCTECYDYADASADLATHNQCGQLIRHDDPTGTLTLDEYALTGGVLEQTQRFLSALEIPDWPQALPARDALLEPVAQAATSSTHFNPLGDVLEQTDAKGNRQQFDYTFDGQLLATHLQLSAQTTAKTLVSDIHYNAYGQVEQETAGNGVISTLAYRAEDGRLLRLQARNGTAAALQDLRYSYDPVGNVLSIEDAALPIRYFANQRVEPKKQYDYDSLYQLIKATGWEAGTASRGPDFNRFDDPGAVANYQQTYRYDAGGNLLELIHVGPQSHSRKLTAARYSNRCLHEQDGRPPAEEEIAAAFDGNGNLLGLQPGQAMSWDLRNQLREVRPVERESADDDLELYVYDGDGMRRRKVRTTQTNARALLSEVRYLPGLEIRTREGTGEVLQVICVQAGRSAMQILHWETAPPSGIANDQYRYNLTDHLGSSSLELDGEAAVISQETYHPYGSTAWFAGRSEVEASYKTVRYSGKERDATGLYYYGFRYYAPWLQRWINPDPAGGVDGLNLYAFVRGSPTSRIDQSGLWGMDDQQLQHFRANPPAAIPEGQETHLYAAQMNQQIAANGLDEFAPLEQVAVTDALFEAPSVLRDAQLMLEQHPNLSASLMKDFFGEDYLKERSTIIHTWARTERLLRQYHNTGFGRGKFVRTSGGNGGTGWIHPEDRSGHIFIPDGFMGEFDFNRVITLIHEVSHLSRVNRFVGVGAATRDFYYLTSDLLLSLQRAADIAGQGNAKVSDLELTAKGFVAEANEWAGITSTTASFDEFMAVIYHNVTPGLRSHMAARNADSVAVAAMMMSVAYKALHFTPDPTHGG